MTYNGPAGVILSRADINLIHSHLLADSTPQGIELRRRIEAFRDSTWQEQAEKRAQAIERCIPPNHS